MQSTAKRFADLTAADLMSHEVVTVPIDMSLREAAGRLASAGISGAPVVDAQGRCVGVLSQSDLIRSLNQGAMPPGGGSEELGKFFADWQVCDLNALPEDAVARYMSGDAITASPATTAREMARLMYAFRIHRLLIVDPDNRVVGVVSSLDLVGAVASAADDGP